MAKKTKKEAAKLPLEPILDGDCHEVMQSLPAGSEAAPGPLVDLVVSNGPRFLTMPELQGVPRTTAEEELTRLGFTDIVVEEDFSNDMLEGYVITTEPGPSQLAERDATVTIYISKGP